MPKRTFWLVTGVALGAGSSMWAERRVRRTLHEAASRMEPDALVVAAGRGAQQAATVAARSAREGARTAQGRVRRAVTVGRGEMQRREEELWAELAAVRTGGDAGTAAGSPRGRR
ncbi:MAG TPA: hypothetical protein VEJ44_05175 [Acidimicrobiales bacterium]|nr:hypothetical protein [Acidimicrobiales bacterium]